MQHQVLARGFASVATGRVTTTTGAAPREASSVVEAAVAGDRNPWSTRPQLAAAVRWRKRRRGSRMALIQVGC